MTFKAPSKPGSYDFRLNDNDGGGKELASVTFTVKPWGEMLELVETQVAPGGAIHVGFHVPGNLAANAWIGIVPSDTPHGSEAVNDSRDVAYQYLNHRANGTLTFKAPTTPGSYDFRLNDTDSNGKELASVTFTVA